MAAPINVFYFGDQSAEPCVSLLDLVREAQNSDLLDTFLRSSFKELQSGITLLPPAEKTLFQGRDFAQLAEHVQSHEIRHVAVASVLSCMTQLGWLIVHRQRNADVWLQEERIVVGVCTGNLAALAAVAARSDTDLLQLAPVFVQLALRLGVEVSRRSAALESSSQAWSAGVSGVAIASLKDELRLFNEVQNLSSLKRVYISAHSASSLTLSGPPTLLQAFLSSEHLRTARKLLLPIYGAFHAEHLPLPDLDSIIGDSPHLGRLVQSNTSLLHSDNAQPQVLRELLRRELGELLQQPLDIENVVQKTCKSAADQDVRLTSIGPARMSGLERALKPSHICRLGSRQLQSPQGIPLALDSDESIAVVGMAGRFPGAESVDELWRVLVEGRDQHGLIPVDRFDIETHVDSTGKTKNTSLTPYGCFYDGVGDFDIALFKMSPREAAQTDPMQRLMLLTAYEALESSGYYDSGDPDYRPKNGTFYGVAGDDYRQANSSQEVDTNYITGGTRAFGPGRVSYYFGWEGPSMSVDAACSASAVAMHQAIASLKLRECDVALSGGANLLTCSDMFAGLSRAKFVNTTGPCKTFDETADGYCRADAFATVVFKRLGDAVRDKDNILGIIRSVETSHAGTAISLTHPEADTQTELFRNVLSAAGMTVDDIDHIELHGTGTQAGDLAESTSVTGLLDRPRTKDRPLTISSVKPNVGHSEAASGVTSLIKGLLMLQHQTIPRHIGIKTRVNPKLPAFDDFGVVVPAENMPYPALSRDGTRRMLVNNFNATGGITAMLLEEHKNDDVTAVDVRANYPITVSAATENTLRQSLIRLLAYIQTSPETNPSHLSYTLTARRLHHRYRFACVVDSTDALIRRLEAELSASSPRHSNKPFAVLVFTGQTSALPRAKQLFETNAFFRSHIERSDQLCREMNLTPFIEVITGQENDHRPVQTQLALVALEVALASLLQSWGICPAAVMGHSLGEYAALCVSNVLSLADTLWLVGKRGLLLESACNIEEYSMVVVAMPASAAAEVVQEFPGGEIACLNSPEQTVISGKDGDVDLIISHLQSLGVKASKLRTPYGFHSQQMDVILEEYRTVAQFIPFHKPSIPFVSTLLGQVVREEGTMNADYLCRQTREPVRFQDGLKGLDSLLEEGQKTFWIELGPSPACIPMIVSTTGAKTYDCAAALSPKKPNWTTLGSVLTAYYTNNGVVRWDEYHKEHLDTLQLLQLPSYPFDLKRYWIQYEGDWMIQKHRQILAAPPKANLESSTLHRLESDSIEKGIRKLNFSTNIAQGELPGLLQSTKVNGDSVWSSSVYADMALAAAFHICKTSELGYPAMQVSNLEVLSDCVPESASLLKTVASQTPTDTNIVHISIASFRAGGRAELAKCRVVLGDGQDWASEANSNAYLYQSRMDLLQLFMTNGQSCRLTRPDMHQFVKYDEASPNIEEILVNPSTLEAVGKLNLLPSQARYYCNPQWFEALLQMPAILLSVSRSTYYTCCGWNTMHIVTPLKVNETYRAHIRMQAHGQSGAMTGDMHILDHNGDSVAVIKQLLFRPSSTNGKAIVRHEQELVSYLGQERQTSQTPSPLFHESLNGPPHSSSTASSTVDSRETISKSTSSSNASSEPKRLPALQPGGAKVEAVNFATIIDLLAAEIGVETESLTDDTLLEDLGVDSIIQISAVSRLQEYIPEPLPSALLLQYNSIAKLKAFFSQSSIVS